MDDTRGLFSLTMSNETKEIDALGNTILHLYAGGDRVKVSKEIWEDGAMVNGRNAEGDTPLHIAARSGDRETVETLLRHGANPLERNNRNRTPRSQPKMAAEMKEVLAEAEEAFRERRRERDAHLWDAKMRETQTESAFGVGVL